MYEDLVRALRAADALPCSNMECTGSGECPTAGCLFREAADAIEELEKKMLNWQATADDHWDAYQHWFHKYMDDMPRWIPVTERLPECEWGAEVGNIEWISCGMVFAGCFGRGGKYRDAYFRTWTDGTEGIDAKDADYWRPIQIPEPPKEVTE